jgi:uncharacterized membrane protein YcaP (DUF421 family)
VPASLAAFAHPDWHALFVNLLELGTGTPSVSVIEKIIRPVLVYVFLVYVLRWFGKRVLAQLNPFDLVVLLTLSNTVQNAIIGNDTSLSGGLIGAAALMTVNYLVVRWYYRGPKAEYQLMEGDDTYLIRDGTPQETAMARLRINAGELTARAHERGFDSLTEVETAVLYPNGTIYMKGTSGDSACLAAILSELQGLRQEVATTRRSG